MISLLHNNSIHRHIQGNKSDFYEEFEMDTQEKWLE